MHFLKSFLIIVLTFLILASSVMRAEIRMIHGVKLLEKHQQQDGFVVKQILTKNRYSPSYSFHKISIGADHGLHKKIHMQAHFQVILMSEVVALVFKVFVLHLTNTYNNSSFPEIDLIPLKKPPKVFL